MPARCDGSVMRAISPAPLFHVIVFPRWLMPTPRMRRSAAGSLPIFLLRRVRAAHAPLFIHFSPAALRTIVRLLALRCPPDSRHPLLMPRKIWRAAYAFDFGASRFARTVSRVCALSPPQPRSFMLIMPRSRPREADPAEAAYFDAAGGGRREARERGARNASSGAARRRRADDATTLLRVTRTIFGAVRNTRQRPLSARQIRVSRACHGAEAKPQRQPDARFSPPSSSSPCPYSQDRFSPFSIPLPPTPRRSTHASSTPPMSPDFIMSAFRRYSRRLIYALRCETRGSRTYVAAAVAAAICRRIRAAATR